MHLSDKVAMEDSENSLDGKGNRCVVLPPNVPLVADSLERRNQNWIARAPNSAVDLIIQVGNSSFHLHKLAMVSRSEYLNRLVFQRGITGDGDEGTLKIQIENLPGSAKSFELVVKFCYGRKIDVTASNAAPLHCAAHFLEMTEDLNEGNLISKTEAFLSFLLLSSWKATFQILKSSEPISSWAKELQIVKRCSEAIAWKASCPDQSDGDTWWFEDASDLRVDHFIEVIQCVKRRGNVKPELVGSCVAQWATKWFSQFALGLDKLAAPKHIALQFRRVSTECLIRILPAEENSVACNFLFRLLKAGATLRVNPDLLCALERRIASMLDRCSVSDLLVKNQGNEVGSLYDTDVVTRVLQCYVCHVVSNVPAGAKLHAVGRLVDGYLAQVARDENLTVESFVSLLEALPQDARYSDDHLYRVIDMYFKAHPYLTEEERTSACRVLEYHRLSQEARQHVTMNDRLPVKLTTEFLLLEQVGMARSLTSNGSSFGRTNTQTIIRVSKDFERRQINAHEMKMMKKDVELIKAQLLELNTCKIKLQRQLKKCIR